MLRTEHVDVVVVGAGLAGLACAFELAERGRDVLVLEAQDHVGGRTASWLDDGMLVESGLHRWLGFYVRLPKLLERAGIDVNEMLCWEDEMEIVVADSGIRAVVGMAPLYKPLKTIAGLLGNNDLLSPAEKTALALFFANGLRTYVTNPRRLDGYSVGAYARRHGVSHRAIRRLLEPLTAGIFFIPPERYSAFAFFGLLAPGVVRPHRIRLGAFMGPMTDVMSAPLADSIRVRGGRVETGRQVTRLVYEHGRVAGVETPNGLYRSTHVVLATSLVPAQRLLKEHFADHPHFNGVLQMPSMSAVTLQAELDEPATPLDRTTFGPGTSWGSFAEQSRSTFRHSRGRLSIILTPPERFLDVPPQDVFRAACADGKRLGFDLESHVTDYRVVALPQDFYSLAPGTDWMRPPQRTPIQGLTLAGDYTRQRFLASMEGAVISGQKAAKTILGSQA